MATREYFQVRAAAYVLLVRDNKIFLLRRANTGWADGQLTLPTGHIEAFETPRGTALREVKEEAGVEVLLENLKFIQVMFRNADTPYADFFFLAEQWSGEPYNAEPAKADFSDWFDLDNLPANTVPNVKSFLENYRAGKLYSEFGWS